MPVASRLALLALVGVVASAVTAPLRPGAEGTTFHQSYALIQFEPRSRRGAGHRAAPLKCRGGRYQLARPAQVRHVQSGAATAAVTRELAVSC